MPTDLAGKPYTPKKARTWLSADIRDSFARQLDCAPEEVEYRLDARDAMDEEIAERAEYEHPFTHRRPGARALSQNEMVN